MLGYQKKKLELIEEEIHNALDDLQEHFNILLEESMLDKHLGSITASWDNIFLFSNILRFFKSPIKRL